MVDQASFDELADGLVAAGIKVTYDNLNEAWRERSETGAGKSDRDWQAPFADWRRRRRYKPHLALLDLPDDMEKAIAAFAGRAMEIARRHAGGASMTLPPPVAQTKPDASTSQQVTELVARMDARLSALAAGQTALAERVASMATNGAPADIPVHEPSSPPPARKPKREGRRRGLSAAMGRLFWDRMMKGFSDRIRERGPMTAQELLETLDEDALAMAKAAFEEIDLTMLTEKLDFRVSKENYFSKLGDGRYAVLEPVPGRLRRVYGWRVGG